MSSITMSPRSLLSFTGCIPISILRLSVAHKSSSFYSAQQLYYRFMQLPMVNHINRKMSHMFQDTRIGFRALHGLQIVSMHLVNGSKAGELHCWDPQTAWETIWQSSYWT